MEIKIMNKKILSLITAFAFFQTFSQTAFAKMPNKKSINHKSQHSAKNQKNLRGKVTIKVNGMVCSFCAQGIKKNFAQYKSVKSTKVNLDKMQVTINLKPGATLSEKEIAKVIVDAGFSYKGVKK